MSISKKRKLQKLLRSLVEFSECYRLYHNNKPIKNTFNLTFLLMISNKYDLLKRLDMFRRQFYSNSLSVEQQLHNECIYRLPRML